jgi:hypothetical protein
MSVSLFETLVSTHYFVAPLFIILQIIQFIITPPVINGVFAALAQPFIAKLAYNGYIRSPIYVNLYYIASDIF